MSYFFSDIMQTAVSHPDLHAIFCNTFLYESFLSTLKSLGFAIVIPMD